MRLNPLRSDERIAIALADLEGDGVRPLVETGLALSPIDARFYSLMGIETELGDDVEGASRFYRYSLSLLPTEIQALIRQLAIDVNETRYEDAALKLELLSRRWPDKWNAIEPVLPYVLSDADAYATIMQRFGDYPPARTLLINSLTRRTEWVPLAYQLVVDWQARDPEGLEGAIGQVSRAFLRDKQYAQAYLLFQMTRPEGASPGFVYNGDFARDFSASPFDWQVRRQSGVSLERKGQGDVASLSVRFLDNPIQFNNIRQVIRLIPGAYELTLAYSGRDLVMPKPIQIALRCVQGNATIAAAPLAAGTFERRDTLAFDVPPTGCPLQEIFFFNEKLPMSWQNRYRGTLMLDSVWISRRS
ncbi:hypothetical protein [Oricola sp.]|uniref:hypothetical protein n=1 Tax=Oricola sp. TaxID=1979950 RepID=UPI0025F64F80|nr:hypothetical protein [Oricola sp.]MCI5073618.1 hypothetical protein [Oricola sp.]